LALLLLVGLLMLAAGWGWLLLLPLPDASAACMPASEPLLTSPANMLPSALILLLPAHPLPLPVLLCPLLLPSAAPAASCADETACLAALASSVLQLLTAHYCGQQQMLPLLQLLPCSCFLPALPHGPLLLCGCGLPGASMLETAWPMRLML
jgi:hypothetical protein